MKHKSIRKKLLRYLDDDLSEREKEKMQRHIESCPGCRDALKAIEALWVTEQMIERQTAPPFLWTRIAGRLQSQTKRGLIEEPENPARWVLRPVLTVVMLFLMLYSGIRLGNLMTGSTGDASEISTENPTDNFGMSYFEILPPGSIKPMF